MDAGDVAEGGLVSGVDGFYGEDVFEEFGILAFHCDFVVRL